VYMQQLVRVVRTVSGPIGMRVGGIIRFMLILSVFVLTLLIGTDGCVASARTL
jgi:hypothetical protein